MDNRSIGFNLAKDHMEIPVLRYDVVKGRCNKTRQRSISRESENKRKDS